MPRRKREAKEDLDGEGGTSSPSVKRSKQPDSRFGGMTEEEVAKLLLPDHMKPGLDIIFVSINLPRIVSKFPFSHSSLKC